MSTISRSYASVASTPKPPKPLPPKQLPPKPQPVPDIYRYASLIGTPDFAEMMSIREALQLNSGVRIDMLSIPHYMRVYYFKRNLKKHLREMVYDPDRCDRMLLEYGDPWVDTYFD